MLCTWNEKRGDNFFISNFKKTPQYCQSGAYVRAGLLGVVAVRKNSELNRQN